MKRILVCLGLLGLAAPVAASAPGAWEQMNRRVDRACIAAAGLLRARVSPDKASFSDTLPIELRVVEGYNRESVIDVKLCVYDRRTRRVAITEASGRLGVNRR